MASDSIFGGGHPVAQVALRGERRRAIERWLAEDDMDFAHAALGETADGPLGPEPLIVSLDEAPLDTLDAPERLARLSARVPVIAILDAEMVDVLPPFLDVEGAEFVAWPCPKEAFMSVLQQAGSLSALREPADSKPIAARHVRDEVERIAQALSALVQELGETATPMENRRSAAESAALIRSIIRRRRARSQFFPAELFADPAWDILLDLAAARLETTRVSISSLCIAAAVPTTTALRWIKGMTAAGILEREGDPDDGRRSFIRLSDRAGLAMESYLTVIGEGVV